MSEVCLSCPIKSKDEDYPVLCAIANRMADVNDPIYDGWIYMNESTIPAHELYDDLVLSDFVEKGKDLSKDKIEKARKCAQLIQWNQCEFRNLEE